MEGGEAYLDIAVFKIRTRPNFLKEWTATGMDTGKQNVKESKDEKHKCYLARHRHHKK